MLSSTAPEFMAISFASFLSCAMSWAEGLGRVRSTISLTMARATPMEEMTSAFSGIWYLKPISLAVKVSRVPAPPPDPTSTIWSRSILYFAIKSSITGLILSVDFWRMALAVSSTDIPTSSARSLIAILAESSLPQA